MKLLKKDFSGKRIGLPQIGAGLAGGDWNIISKIIEDELKGEDVTIVIYEPSPSITFTEDDLTTTDITKAISSMQTPNVQSKLNLDDLI
jgi:O-acetyl-ADP-ribose deacetylase (regulator of RNase III)